MARFGNPLLKEQYRESDGFVFKLEPDGRGYELIGVNSFVPNIAIPAEYQGVPVTRIGSTAFSDRGGIKRVAVPRGVTHIGDFAFEKCDALSCIEFGGSLREIGAFGFCSALTEITLPASLKRIGTLAFAGCTNLKHINFLGTTREWKKINLTPDRTLYSAAVIHCTDGDYLIK